MINSMTGFGRSSDTVNERDITVEIKSVNHRYFEASIRTARSYSFLEDKLKTLLQSKIARGKVDVGLMITTKQDTGFVVEPNLQAAKGYYEALKAISDELGLKMDPSVSLISKYTDIFTVTSSLPDEDELWKDVSSVASKALEQFLDMRKIEGERLVNDILSRLKLLEQLLERIEADNEGRIERYREKLFAKMTKILEDKTLDENRIMLEAALFADRYAVEEETVRLRSHISQFRDILKSKGGVGRKLDFLIQEFNREANTIGSKSSEVENTAVVVEMKSEIEKIREQIQNIE